MSLNQARDELYYFIQHSVKMIVIDFLQICFSQVLSTNKTDITLTLKTITDPVETMTAPVKTMSL